MIFKMLRSSKRIYLDYAASTPFDPDVRERALQLPASYLGANPGALHREGLEARKIVTEARERIAKVLDAHSDEIIFTSGATESDNLAIQGKIRAWLSQGVLAEEITIVASILEHPAVLETSRRMCELYGVHMQVLPAVNGVVDVASLEIQRDQRVCLVTVMYVHNELGTVQPIRELAKRIRYLKKQHEGVDIVLHVDATQAPLFYSLSVQKLGVDLMTIGSTKLYMQKGVGILFKARNVRLEPIMFGGGQEFGLRPGTEPMQLMHAFSHALSLAQEKKEECTAKIRLLQNHFEVLVHQKISNARISCEGMERTPHISHLAIPGFDSELLVIELDARGVAVSSQSACNKEEQAHAYVRSLYDQDTGFLRFSFGKMTTTKELDRAVTNLQDVIRKYSRES